MQFDTKVLYHHKKIVVESILDGFKKLNGTNNEGFMWEFPTKITQQDIQQIIQNTCFVCGGLMQDGQALQNEHLTYSSYDGPMDNYEGEIKVINPARTKVIEVRKCQDCGHSHT